MTLVVVAAVRRFPCYYTLIAAFQQSLVLTSVLKRFVSFYPLSTMGCKQSTAISHVAPEPVSVPQRNGAAPPRPAPGAPPAVTVGTPAHAALSGNPGLPNGVVRDTPSPGGSAPVEANPSLVTNTGLDGPDVVGTGCVPPPGGREGGIVKAGLPPDNLMDILGEPAEDGLVRRPEVTLAGGGKYDGTWKVGRRSYT